MRKKTIFCLSLAAILLLSGGCGVVSEIGESLTQPASQTPTESKKEIVDSEPASDPGVLTEDLITVNNIELPIFDKDHQKIGSITCFNYSVLTDQGLLYSKIPENAPPSATPSELEYHLYNIDSGEDHLLGTVRDWIYEASYEAVEKDDHLYISVSTGEYTERENRLQTIYDIDLSEYKMTPLLQIEGGIPYNSYTIAGDELLVAELLDTGDTDLIRVDLKHKPAETIVHKYDEKQVFWEDSIRRILSEEDRVYLLRLDWDEKENYSLYFDTCDQDLKRLSSLDITDVCVSVGQEGNREESQNECRQFVGEFVMKDSFFFYQNFSVTNFLGQLKGETLKRFAETDELISYVSCTDPKAPLLFYRKFGDDSTDRNERNLFYLIDPKDNTIKTAEFYSSNVLCTFRHASQSPSGKILLSMDYRPSDGGEGVSEELHYLDRSDLTFK